MRWQLVFDIGRQHFSPSAISTVVGAIALGLLCYAIAAWRKTRKADVAYAGTLLMLFGVLVTIGVAVHFFQYQRLQSVRASGTFNTVTGTVANFSGGGTNSPETFSVNGHRFDVWPALVSESFHDRLIDGGPDLSGKNVDIGYTERGEIILLRVATDAPPVATPPTASNGALSQLEWISSANAISYLEPETDNVWITLSCEPNTGRVRIEEPLRDRPTSTITLVSGDIAETYPATMGRADEELGIPPGATAHANSASPLLQRFRRTGEIRVQGGRPMPARTDGERQQVEAFFTRCG